MNPPLQASASPALQGFVDLGTARRNGSKVIRGGKGVFVFDDHGTPYLEAVAGMWCTSFGFSEQALVDAAVAQMHALPYYHTVAYKTVGPALALAERLAELVPIRNAKVYFALSGSEANDFLVKAIRYYNNAVGRPRKKKIIARRNSYHGATLAASALTGIAINRDGFDVSIPGIVHVSDPNFYAQGLPAETEVEFCARLVKELDETIQREDPETVAAFIVEPITGGGGVTIPPAGYHEAVRDVLDRYDVKFLADEVITGFHRTGPLWGCESTNLRPDTMTLAKGMTSAYMPLAAVVLSNDIYEGLERGSNERGFFGHGSTYSGHPVSCAVGLKVLDLIRERDIASHVARVSQVFAGRLERLREHPLVGDVRYRGLMGAVEFVADRRNRQGFNPVGSFGKAVREHAEQKHLLICRQLAGRDACAFAPPLIISEEEVHELFDRFQRALDDVAAVHRR